MVIIIRICTHPSAHGLSNTHYTTLSRPLCPHSTSGSQHLPTPSWLHRLVHWCHTGRTPEHRVQRHTCTSSAILLAHPGLDAHHPIPTQLHVVTQEVAGQGATRRDKCNYGVVSQCPPIPRIPPQQPSLIMFLSRGKLQEIYIWISILPCDVCTIPFLFDIYVYMNRSYILPTEEKIWIYQHVYVVHVANNVCTGHRHFMYTHNLQMLPYTLTTRYCYYNILLAYINLSIYNLFDD